jgi:hypothetical protein
MAEVLKRHAARQHVPVKDYIAGLMAKLAASLTASVASISFAQTL